MSSEVFVYVICERINVDYGPVKVGISDNPWYRAHALSAGNPRKLAVHTVYSFPSRQDAREVEQSFHRANSDYRVHGEWFNTAPEKAARQLVHHVREMLRGIGFAGDELELMVRNTMPKEKA